MCMSKTILPVPHRSDVNGTREENSDPVERFPNPAETAGSCRRGRRPAGRAAHGRARRGDPGPRDSPAAPKDVSRSDQAEARAAIKSGEIPGQDEIVHSANITHVANIPKDVLSGFNTDLAFQGKYAFAGNYDGFRIFDISNPKKPKTVAQVLCPGSQNDISVSGNLLFLSTDSSRSDSSCNSTTQPATEKSSWEGMKVFDISDKRNPRYVAAVETACGSHTHTLVPERDNVYVYVSSYSPNAAYPDCQPPHDGISVIKVPRKAPHKAAVVGFPVLFPGEGPDGGGNPGAPTNPGVSKTTGCHDITVLPSKDLAAAPAWATASCSPSRTPSVRG